MSRTRWLTVPWSGAHAGPQWGERWGGDCLYKAIDTLPFVQKDGEAVKGPAALWRGQWRVDLERTDLKGACVGEGWVSFYVT